MSVSTELETNTDFSIISEDTIKDKIYIIREQQVMLDYDLARIYGYETKAFNQQVKRNIERFPGDFMFELTDEEALQCSRSQNVTLNTTKSRGHNLKYNPHAFTEQGIYMLMSVLKGELAVKQSIELIRIFKSMKDYLYSNQNMLGSHIIDNLLVQTNQNTLAIAELRDNMISKSDLPEIIRSFGFSENQGQYLICKGEMVEAGIAYKAVYAQAKSTIFIIDNYIGLKTLHLLKDVNHSINISIFSDNLGPGLSQQEYNDFKREYGINVDFKKTMGAFHDRYIAIDLGLPTEQIYHCGASSKDADKRINTISLLSDKVPYQQLFNRILTNPPLQLR